MSDERVVVAIDASLHLHRPEERNGLDLARFAALLAAGEYLAAQRIRTEPHPLRPSARAARCGRDDDRSAAQFTS